MIHQAAILHQGIVYTLPRPARHHDVIKLIADLEGSYNPCDSEQGFVAVWEEGVDLPLFLRRKPARRIAEENGQLLPRECGSSSLYSEDVW